MATPVRIVVGLLLLAHGLVHLLYLIENAGDPDFAFSLDSARVVPASVRRTVGLVLIAATVAAFALVALAVWGVPGLAVAWPVPTVVASVPSLLLLAAFWNRQLWIGVALDVALVAVAVVRPGWTETIA